MQIFLFLSPNLELNYSKVLSYFNPRIKFSKKNILKILYNKILKNVLKIIGAYYILNLIDTCANFVEYFGLFFYFNLEKR